MCERGGLYWGGAAGEAGEANTLRAVRVSRSSSGAKVILAFPTHERSIDISRQRAGRKTNQREVYENGEVKENPKG